MRLEIEIKACANNVSTRETFFFDVDCYDVYINYLFLDLLFSITYSIKKRRSNKSKKPL